MTKSANQVKADWRARGITMAGWARQNGYSVSAVNAVLRGQHKGYRGKSHEIMVALGMKKKPKCRF
ncbi:DNA-binding protein [Roseinatronobacter sp.]|uniref:DNA-binding protein n=1 Tax=Roseinatronobacter sp. TaxID=1945755 RepID=UPI0025E798EC|nr:DNA-binding protein [Roseibaca sp.]